MSVFLFALAVMLLAVLGEVVRYFTAARDVSRKFVHVGTGILYLVASFYMSGPDIVLVSILMALGLLITRRFKFFPSVHVVQRVSWGEIYYPLGVALAAVLALPDNAEAFRFGVSVLAFADAAAALVGIHAGKLWYRIMHNRKTVEGSGAFFLVTLSLWASFKGGFDPRMILGSAGLMLVEGSLVFGLDNLIVPPVAAMLYISLVG